jgi:hypothetical protein
MQPTQQVIFIGSVDIAKRVDIHEQRLFVELGAAHVDGPDRVSLHAG